MTATHFFDTSALFKHYQPEPGTAEVDALLAVPGATQLVTRLAVVEFHSTVAKKVRSGQLAATEFDRLARLFRRDVTARRLRVVRVLVPHFRSAEGLIRRYGLTQNLRTLDAIQLAAALGLNHPARPVTFVCADHALCAVATAEGLTVVNPEAP